MEKYYKFSGVEIAVSIKDEWMYEDDRSLKAFRVDHVDEPHYFKYELEEKLKEPVGEKLASFPDYIVYGKEKKRIRYIGVVSNGWQGAYIRAEHDGRKHHIQMKLGQQKSIGVKTVLNAMETEHLLIENNGIVLHASYIEWNNKAILFTAPSGNGKSTQADLWASHRQAEIINGDRAVIRIIDGKIFADGIPFSGSSTYCKNRTLPLAAIEYKKST